MKKFLDVRKTPTTWDNYVGVEIEFLIPATDKAEVQLEDALVEAKLEYNVHLGQDGSIDDVDFEPKYGFRKNVWGQTDWVIINNNERMNGHEIRILVTERDMEDVIKRTCDVIKSVGGKVNRTCGLHVHLDMRNRNFEESFERLYKSQKLLYSTQPETRKTGQYSKPMNRRIKNVTSKYYGINKLSYEKYRTIEVRMHEGTIEHEQITNWINALIKIVDSKDKPKVIKSFDDLKLNKRIAGYFDKRVKRFAKA